MLKSCRYCGGIHPRGYDCPNKPRQRKKFTDQNKFRSLNVWAKKRTEIKERDKYLCQICIRKLYNTLKQYNYTDIEVHHIVALIIDYSRRLDNKNLISLCAYHHKMADRGEIPVQILLQIAAEQEEKYQTR